MKGVASQTNRIALPVFALCVFFLALIWGSYIRQSSYEKQDTIQFAVEKNSNLAVALEQFTVRTLRNADAVLQFAIIAYSHQGDSTDLQKLLRNNSLNRDFIEGLAIIDKHGRLKMADIPYSKDSVPDFSDRSYFIFHSQNNKDTLLISKPLLSKTIGKPVIVISRRINDARGDFNGVVALQIQPSTFTSFYAQARLLPNDIISLITPDGVTYARRTGNVESYGENISKSPLFGHVAQNEDSFYFAKDAIKQIPTWFSYRKLKDYPIIATVGSSEQDMLQSYRSRQMEYITPRIIISVLIILFSFSITMILLHRRKLSQHLSKKEELYQRRLTEQVITAQEREREWIGRELHDNVNQVLTTVKLYLEMASRNTDDPLIPRSMNLINNSINEIRNLSHQLSAPTLGTRSLIDSINGLIEMVRFSTNLIFEFDHSDYQVRMAMSQKLAVYRILQEQLNNIVKHADATRVFIRLSEKDGVVSLTVRDNGKGFDSTCQTDGMGLNSIISRAKIFGGTVHIQSGIQQGCCVLVMLPVAPSKSIA